MIAAVSSVGFMASFPLPLLGQTAPKNLLQECEPTGVAGVCSLSPLARNVELCIEVRGPVIELVTSKVSGSLLR